MPVFVVPGRVGVQIPHVHVFRTYIYEFAAAGAAVELPSDVEGET